MIILHWVVQKAVYMAYPVGSSFRPPGSRYYHYLHFTDEKIEASLTLLGQGLASLLSGLWYFRLVDVDSFSRLFSPPGLEPFCVLEVNKVEHPSPRWSPAHFRRWWMGLRWCGKCSQIFSFSLFQLLYSRSPSRARLRAVCDVRHPRSASLQHRETCCYCLRHANRVSKVTAQVTSVKKFLPWDEVERAQGQRLFPRPAFSHPPLNPLLRQASTLRPLHSFFVRLDFSKSPVKSPQQESPTLHIVTFLTAHRPLGNTWSPWSAFRENPFRALSKNYRTLLPIPPHTPCLSSPCSLAVKLSAISVLLQTPIAVVPMPVTTVPLDKACLIVL